MAVEHSGWVWGGVKNFNLSEVEQSKVSRDDSKTDRQWKMESGQL